MSDPESMLFAWKAKVSEMINIDPKYNDLSQDARDRILLLVDQLFDKLRGKGKLYFVRHLRGLKKDFEKQFKQIVEEDRQKHE